MKYRLLTILILTGFWLLTCFPAVAQYPFITQASPARRLQSFWQYCSQNLISDKDSATTCQWLITVEKKADSLHDAPLKKYATYFRLCFRVLFSENYELYFAKGDDESVANVYRKGQAWARQNGYTDIEAACEHYIGEVYYYAGRYEPAFTYLLRADDLFQKTGYQNVPAISTYLYDLGLNYFKFKEWDKALQYFLQAARYPFYSDWVELSTFNSIGLIYFHQHQWGQAIPYYRQTIAKAYQYGNKNWVGIASGNLGNVFAQQGRSDSALFYHTRNFRINQADRAPEDAAWSALAIAQLYLKKARPDSANWYLDRGQALADKGMLNTAARLTYQKELLQAMVDLHKQQADYRTALVYSDSMGRVTDRLHQLMDDKTVKEAEAKRYLAEINLLQAEKQLARYRLFVFIGSFLLLGAAVAYWFNRYRLHKRQQIAEAAKEKKRLVAGKQRVEDQLKRAEQSLTAYLETIIEKTNFIENLGAEIERLKAITPTTADLHGLTLNMEKMASATILTEEGWNYFKGLFEQVHPGYVERLRMKYTGLSPAETRMLILARLSLPSREMAQMLGISMDSLRKARYRLRKKLNLEEETGIDTLVQQV